MDNRVGLMAGANRHPLMMSRTVIVLVVAAREKHRKRITSRASDQVADGYHRYFDAYLIWYPA